MQDNPEKTEYDSFYQTGPTQPEKSNAGPMSLVLMLVILLGGMMIVMEMMDFSILPEALAQRESGLQVGTVPEVRFFRQFACALHRQKAPSPALEAFLALLRDQTATKTGPLSP